MIAEAALEIFQFNGFFDFYKNHYWLIVGVIIIGCILKNWDCLKLTVKIADSSDVTITLQVCDALSKKGAVIIPTNTTFDTKMDDEFISVGSVQGQYQIKYFKNRISDLDLKIENGLKGKQYTQLNDGRTTKKKRYPIGTICRVSEKDRRAYFIANSDINEKGIPIDVNASDISQALVSLWDALAIEGNQEPYSIPLLGTGKAKVKDASRDEIVKEVILTFLAANKDHKITENLTICIHPNDYEKVNWDDLCEFLKFESQYANLKPFFSKPNGAEETTPLTVRLKDEQIEENQNENTYKKTEPILLEDTNLTEKEQIIVALLQGNEMKKNELASATGLSLNSTTRILKSLVDKGVIESKGTSRNIVYFVPLSKQK